MAEHDDAAAGELTEGAVAVLDPEIDDIEELDDADPGGPDERVDERQSQIVQVARQGALNLTTIDWQRADADVQRILDSATGEFYDDFAKRSAPFIKVVKEAKSTSTGSITEAGLESEAGDSAQVLVAVAVKTSNVGAPDQQPREWRMRIAVQKVGDVMKVSNVEFVP